MNREAAAIVDQLTTEEKVSLLSGSDVWRTAPIERLGVPAIKVTDGPNGARGDSTTGARAICLPSSISLASSFDADLVHEVGRLLGRETARKGAHVLLAPTINLAKHPLGGRNFESFGEEPFLTTRMAVAYVSGVQDNEGVGACAKHFVANDVEYARLTVSSEVDERTLREVYLPPFEATVQAGVWSLMAAYPKLNGEHCTEHHWLLTELLRDEWGFDGLVMSDWGATHHPVRPVTAGLDLEMPGPPRALGPKLLAAIEAGEVPMEALDARARQVIDLVVRSGRIGVMDEPAEQSVDLPEERDLARRAAASGMVLLRNEGVLPLDPEFARTVAVIGPNADPGVIQGGGSAELPAHRTVSPLAGLADVFESVTHQPGCIASRYLPLVPTDAWEGEGEARLRHEIFAGDDLSAEPVVVRSSRSIFTLIAGGLAELPEPMRWSQRWTGTLRIDVAGTHRFSVFAIGPSRVFVDGVLVVDNWTTTERGDGFFQKASTEVVGEASLDIGSVDVVVEWTRGDDAQLGGVRFGWSPPIDEEQMMDDAVASAAAADAAVLVVGLDSDWETESHDRPMFGLPGRQDELVRRVTAANPNTVVVVNAGGPIDMPWLDDVPATIIAWYPGQEFGSALGDVLSGRVDASGRLPVTFPVRMEDTPTFLDVPGDGDKVHYRDGLFVGHRWYDARDISPRAEFGFGLSYASFELSEPSSTESNDGGVTISVPVRNVSDRFGTCVVQVYLEPPHGEAARPVRSLAGFASQHVDAGADETVTLRLPPRAFEIWTASVGWHVPPGAYQMHVATSSRSFVHSLSVER